MLVDEAASKANEGRRYSLGEEAAAAAAAAKTQA
jgi:hypothetical protein